MTNANSQCVRAEGKHVLMLPTTEIIISKAADFSNRSVHSSWRRLNFELACKSELTGVASWPISVIEIILGTAKQLNRTSEMGRCLATFQFRTCLLE